MNTNISLFCKLKFHYQKNTRYLGKNLTINVNLKEKNKTGNVNSGYLHSNFSKSMRVWSWCMMDGRTVVGANDQL